MKARSSTSSRENPRDDNHESRVVGIVNLGHQPSWVWQGKKIESQFKVELTYETTDDHMQDGRPFFVSEELNNTDNDGGNLYNRCMLMGADISNLSTLLNKKAAVTTKVNDGGYAKLKGVSGLPSAYNIPELINPTYMFDAWEEGATLEAFDKLGKFTQDKIKSALDFDESFIAKQLLLEETAVNDM